MVKKHASLLLAALFAIGCAPELDDRSFLVQEPRILAIQADPPEAAPGTEVAHRLLWAGPDGAEPPELRWAYCSLRKPLAELGPVHPGCLRDEPDALEPLGTGFSVVGAIPRQACRRFGPDLPEPVAGAPAGRPVDPDATGGYYQPVVVHAWNGDGASWSLGLSRIRCGIAGATPSQLAEMARRYVSNQNPAFEELEMRRGDAWEPLHPHDPPSNANAVKVGETVVIRASWVRCEEAPCRGAEPYVVFDPQSRSIQERRETLRVSWFSTDGFFDHDRTGAAADAGDWAENTWTAPDTPGVSRIWLVLRDERGGVGWEEVLIRVLPQPSNFSVGTT